MDKRFDVAMFSKSRQRKTVETDGQRSRTRLPAIAALVTVSALGLAACSSSTDQNPYGEDDYSDIEVPAETETLSDLQPGQAEQTLELKDGATITLPGYGDADGMERSSTPVEVSFESVECAKKWPGQAFDYSMNVIDAVPDKGDTLCEVGISVKNVSKVPVSFSLFGESLLASNGNAYTEWEGHFNHDDWFQGRGTSSAGGSSMNPGKTEYDAVVYAIPEDAAPEAIKFTYWEN